MVYSKKWRVFVELSTLRYEVVVDYCVRKINTGCLGCLLIAIYNGDWEP